MTRANTSALAKRAKACRECAGALPHEPRPVFSFVGGSRVLLVGQAPGRRVHESGVPWDDPSGERLRDWLGVDRPAFYDARNFAIVPMGFCFPGTGKSGDLPPRPECAPLWMEPIRAYLKEVRLTLLIGSYAQAYFLGDRREATLTATLQNWRAYAPQHLVLPHPSPRNNIWLKKNPWFETEMLPVLRRRIRAALKP